MRTFLVSILSLGALTSVALAEEPVALTDTQMDAVTAGGVKVIGGRGGDATAISAAAIIVEGDNSGDLTATSGAATATGGDGGSASFTPAP